MFDVVVMLLLSAWVILSVNYKGSLLSQSFSIASNSSASTYQQLANKFDQNHILSNLPLLLFWGCVGLIVYYFAVAAYRAFHDVAEVNAELHYVNASRRKQLNVVFLHLVIRVVTLAAWFVYGNYFLHVIVPFALSDIRSIAAGGSTLTSEILRLVDGVVIGLLALHLNTIFLRLIFLRPRLFGVTYE